MFKKNLIQPFVFSILIILLGFSCSKDDEQDKNTVRDADGNVYKTVKIGDQVWMAENLKTTKLNNGDPIPCIEPYNAWLTAPSGAYCNYDNNADTAAVYGRLYNWHAVNSGILCPKGWHVPSLEEWDVLINWLGGVPVAGGKMKEEGFSHWANPNAGATNESGFTALGAGLRHPDGAYQVKKLWTNWWSSTGGTGYAWEVYLTYSSPAAIRVQTNSTFGFSVRCLKD